MAEDWQPGKTSDARVIRGRYVTKDGRSFDGLSEEERNTLPLIWVKGRLQIRCCGIWLECTGFTNTCSMCAADYNHGGQRLAPRAQWGEETSESVEDILSVDYEKDY